MKEFTLSEAWEGFSTEKKTYHLREAVEYLNNRIRSLENYISEMARADLEGAEEELSKKDLTAAATKYIASAKKRMGTDDPKKIAAGLGATFRKAKDGAPVKVGKVEISDEDAAAFKKEVKSQLGIEPAKKSSKKKTSKTEEELKADGKKKEPEEVEGEVTSESASVQPEVKSSNKTKTPKGGTIIKKKKKIKGSRQPEPKGGEDSSGKEGKTGLTGKKFMESVKASAGLLNLVENRLKQDKE